MLFKSFQILFLIGLSSLYANELCPKNDLVDFVKSNGSSWVECVSTKKPINFKSNLSTYIVDVKPSIHKQKKRVLYIFDLSKNSKFLNLSGYANLEIDGDYKGCKVALADRDYFKKEDNYPLVLKDNKASIPLLFSHIDIRFLKYLIVIAPIGKKVKIDKIKFTKREIKDSNNLKLSAWIWNPKKADLSIVKRDDISRLYVQIGRGFATFIENISKSKKEIFGLDGSPTNILDFKQLKKDILYLSELKKRGMPVVGFQIDVEPYLLKGFANHRDEYYLKYLNMVKELSTLADKNGLKFSVVMPFWFDSIYVNGEALSSKVVDLTDETVLMSYRSKPKEVIEISEDILAYAEHKGKKVRIGMEMKKVEDEKHTLYRQVGVLPCISDGKFTKDCTLLNFIRSYDVKGIKISFYKQYNKAKELLKKEAPYKSFNGFVIHGYKSINKL